MSTRVTCPRCDSNRYKKNGRIHTGKRNHRCKDCDRQFVLNAANRLIDDADRATMQRLLAERVSLHGICRVMGVSFSWLIDFAVQCYQAAPDDLNVRLPNQPSGVIVQRLDVNADEAWSYVGKKANPYWLWIALDAHTRQVLAFYVGDRSKRSARKLWKKIPAVYREHATFYTDGLASYQGVIPNAQHRVITKRQRHTQIGSTLAFAPLRLVAHRTCVHGTRVSHLLRARAPLRYGLRRTVGGALP